MERTKRSCRSMNVLKNTELIEINSTSIGCCHRILHSEPVMMDFALSTHQKSDVPSRIVGLVSGVSLSASSAWADIAWAKSTISIGLYFVGMRNEVPRIIP